MVVGGFANTIMHYIVEKTIIKCIPERREIHIWKGYVVTINHIVIRAWCTGKNYESNNSWNVSTPNQYELLYFVGFLISMTFCYQVASK